MNRIFSFACQLLSLALASSILASPALASPQSDLPKELPNILIILADDLGYSDLGCYGSEIATPNLDHLASQGVRFTQFYNTARCWPTRGALLTGYYAQQIRRDAFPQQKNGQGTRPAWAPLITNDLRDRGYRNYHSGKWHIDGKPMENGFDHSLEIGGGQNNYFRTKGITRDGKPIESDDSFYVTDAIADHALECLREHAKLHPKKPFFQFVAFTSPHFPLHARQDDIDRYQHRYADGWNVIRQKRWENQQRLGFPFTTISKTEPDLGPPYPFPNAFPKLGEGEIDRPLPWNELSPVQKSFQAQKMAIHAAMIDRMDHQVGRILSTIHDLGYEENTLVMFLSDNGASAEIMVRGEGHDPRASMGSAATYLCLGPGWSNCSNTPFRKHKTWVHEGGISTPLIIRWPNTIPNVGAFNSFTGHVIDIVPTIREIAKIDSKPLPNAPAYPGESMLNALRTPSERRNGNLWWNHEGNRAFLHGTWKAVASGASASWELYDLAVDRAEQNDLAQQYPELVSRMAEQWNQSTEQFRRDAQSVP